MILDDHPRPQFLLNEVQQAPVAVGHDAARDHQAQGFAGAVGHVLEMPVHLFQRGDQFLHRQIIIAAHQVQIFRAGDRRIGPLAEFGDLLQQTPRLVVQHDFLPHFLLLDRPARQLAQVVLEVDDLLAEKIPRVLAQPQFGQVEQLRRHELFDHLRGAFHGRAGVKIINLVE